MREDKGKEEYKKKDFTRFSIAQDISSYFYNQKKN